MALSTCKKDLEGGNQTETILDESQIIETSCRKVNSWLAGEKGPKEQEETNEDSGPLSSAASNTSWHSCKSSSNSSSSLSPDISSQTTTSKASLTPTISSQATTSKASLTPDISSQLSISKTPLPGTYRGPKVPP